MIPTQIYIGEPLRDRLERLARKISPVELKPTKLIQHLIELGEKEHKVSPEPQSEGVN
jgi:hypothetical protein